MFKNIGIVLKKSLSSSESSVVSGLLSVLLKNTKTIYSTDQIDYEGVDIVDHEKFNSSVDLIIVFGGDGTLLGAARKFIENEIPILGINMGAVGFLTDVNIENFESVINDVFKGNYILEERSLVEAQFSGQEVFGLNEVLIHSGSYAQLMRYRLLIDGTTVYEQRSDGLIVATPTGSTAYSLSAGGPIVTPEVESLIITPTAAHTLTSRPLVVPANANIEIQFSKNTDPILFTADGQIHETLLPDNRVCITKANFQIKLISFSDNDYFQNLRAKMGWGKRGEKQ